MPLIRANRDSIDDRFSVVGFTIRSESPLFEVGIATDPELFRAENRARRNRHNFFSSRGAGALRARRGEAVYLVPPEVLANFIGGNRLYFGMATYSETNRARPEFVQNPTAGNPYVNISGLTERGLRRLMPRPSSGSGYGHGGGPDVNLDWGGDAIPVAPSAVAPSSPPPLATQALTPGIAGKMNGTGKSNGAATAGGPAMSGGNASNVHAASLARPTGVARAIVSKRPSGPTLTADLTSAATALDYDDGYGTMPSQSSTDTDDARHGIDGPIPDDSIPAMAQALRPARPLDAPALTPEYPKASRFVPAATANYRAVSQPRQINRVVIHITDGSPKIDGTLSWFRNPQAGVSAHYVVGQDGEVVQLVRNNDVAWHANAANGDSIGIEHVANTRGLQPTQQQYAASAALVSWLCSQFSIPVDRAHIQGHSEADPKTSHTACPNAVWDWNSYMSLFASSGSAATTDTASGLALAIAAGRRMAPTRKPVPTQQAMHTPPAASARALLIGPDDIDKAQRYAPEWADLFNWTVPDWINGYLQGRSMSVQRIEDAAGELNLDRYEVRIAKMPTLDAASSDVALLNYIRTNLNSFLDTGISEFIPYASGDDDVKWTSATPTGTVFKIDIAGPKNAAVVASLVEDRRWRFTTVHTPWSGDHPVSGHREFGVRTDDNGATVFIRASDRATFGILDSVTFAGADRLWRSFQSKLTDWVNSNGGSATAPEPFSERFHPEVVRILYGKNSTAQATAQELSAHKKGKHHRPATAKSAAIAANTSFAIHWDTVPYYPQSSPKSCWAASAAMVVGWRDQQPVADSEIAAKVPAFEAYKTGLFPTDRRALVDAWNLVAEPPASYTVTSWGDLLNAYGPIYLDMSWDTSGHGGHARVLVGMESDGNPEGSDTTMFMHDPWPGTAGKIKLSYADFLALYEGRVGTEGQDLQYQLLHADSVPAGVKSVLAAPFALMAAADVEPQSPTQTATSAAVIAPIVIEGDADGVSFELDQMTGWRHPNDVPPNPMPPARDGEVIELDDWPRIDVVSDSPSASHVEDVPIARRGQHLTSIGPADVSSDVGHGGKDAATYAGLAIAWQCTGQSVGNVSIRNISRHSSGEWKLHVKARISRRSEPLPDEDRKVAGVSLVCRYHFSHPEEDEQIAVTKVRLRGDGTRTIDFHWV